MKVKGVEQDFIPYVGQLVLDNIPVEGLTIVPYQHGLIMVCDSLPTMEKLSNLI